LVQSEGPGGSLAVLDAIGGKQKFTLQSDLVLFPLPCLTTPPRIPCAFSPDGRVVAVSEMFVEADLPKANQAPTPWRGHYVFFDLLNGKEIQRIAQGGDFRNRIAFSPDSKRFAAAEGSHIRIWIAATGKRLWESPMLDHSVTALAFSPDGRRLASALRDSTILIWDVASKK
jgi:WD40 repeat protein